MKNTCEINAGDKGKAICEHCRSQVVSEYQYRNVPFSDGTGTATNILVGVCIHCNSVVSLPHQSVGKVSKLCNEKTKR